MAMTLQDQQINDMARRLYNLEQLVTSLRGPSFSNSNFPDGITVGTPGITVGGAVNLDLVSSPATGLVLTPGSFYGDIYVDVDWDAPADGSASMYDVEWSIKNGDGTYSLVNVARIGGNTYRIENLRPQTTYGIRVYVVNGLGVLSNPTPAVGMDDVTTLIDSTIPSPVGGIAVYAAPHALIVRWNDNSDPDVVFGAGSYVVEVSTNATFTAIVKTSHVSGTIASFSDLPSATTYYVRVSAIDASGNQGPPTSAGATTTGQVGLGDMAVNSVGANQVIANSIATTHIATVGLDAGVVKFGTMDGNLATIIHLKANNIDSSSITTSTITLNGGALQAGSPPTTGLLLNSQGLRLYSGGVAKVVLDVGGTATFGGTISSTATITGATVTGAVISGGTITGTTFRTAVSGNSGGWIELGTANVATMWIHAGNATESVAPKLSSSFFGVGGGDAQALYLNSGWPSGGNSSYIELDSRSATNAASNIYISSDSVTVYGTFNNFSSIVGKRNVSPIVDNYDALGLIRQMKPVRYKRENDPKGKWSYSLVAEELQAILPDLVVPVQRNFDEFAQPIAETQLTIKTLELIPFLIDAIRLQQDQIDKLMHPGKP